MSRSFIIIWIVSCFGFWLSCNAEIRKVTILETSDIHGRISPDDVKRIGGIITEERSGAGVNNTLLIDCGDLTQGTYAVMKTDGMIAMAFINAFRYAVWVPGNHEFDYGLDTLIRQRKTYKGAALAANLEFSGSRSLFEPWKMFERNGLKIAVVGLTFPELRRLPFKGEKEFRLRDYLSVLDRIIPEIMRARPHIIILATHYSVSMSYRKDNNSLFVIASRFPQINLILGGHTHQVNPGQKLGGRTIFIEPGVHANGVMRSVIEYDTEAGKTVGITSRFITEPPGRTAGEYPPVMEKSYNAVSKSAAEVVGELPSSKKPEYALRKLIGEAVISSVHADIAFISPPKPDAILTGKVTEGDLFKACPYDDTVVSLRLTPEQIKTVAYEQLTSKSRHNRQYPYKFRVKVQRKAGTVKFLQPMDRKYYICAFNGYTISNASRWFPALNKIVSDSKPEDSGITLRNALKKYIKEHY